MIQSVCVFCGSREGNDPRFKEAAVALGKSLATSGRTVVYGGGRVGLMGCVADAALEAGGRVHGIIPGHIMDLEVGHDGLSQLDIVPDMHTRKERMYTLSDAFVTLPGGLGTFDETIEIVTWKQLQLHTKPSFVVNTANYWDRFEALVDQAIVHGFADANVRRYFQVLPDIESTMRALGEGPRVRG